jgi:hypothetical protein
MRRRAAVTASVFAVLGGAVAVAAQPAFANGTVLITFVQGPSAQSATVPMAVEGQMASPSINAVFVDTNAVGPGSLTVTINYGDGSAPSTNQGPGADPSLLVTQVGGAGGTTYTVIDNHVFPEESGAGSPPAPTFTTTINVRETANSANTDSRLTSAQVADAPIAAPYPKAAPSVFSGTGGTNASGGALSAMTAFEAAIGGANNGSGPPEHAGGFRTITWDPITLDGTDPGSTTVTPNHTVAIAADRYLGKGAFMPGQVAVSNDGFVDVNPSVGGPTRFPAFSSANVLAPFNTNQTELDFVTPSGSGPPVPQAVRGFGAIFLNDRIPGTSSIAYYDGAVLLDTVAVPASSTGGTAAFEGALFSAAVVTKVVISTGTGLIFSFDGTTVSPGGSDNPPVTNLVALDNFVFSEPAPVRSFKATAGTPYTSTVDSFVDSDPNGTAHDYRATIDWGDGTVGRGTVTAKSSGAFNVTPVTAHSYQAGTWSGTVTVTDFGGAAADLPFTAIVHT